MSAAGRGRRFLAASATALDGCRPLTLPEICRTATRCTDWKTAAVSLRSRHAHQLPCHQQVLTPIIASHTCHQQVTLLTASHTCHQQVLIPLTASHTCHQQVLTTLTASHTCHQQVLTLLTASHTCHQQVLKGHSGAELHIYFLVHLESIYYEIFFYSKIVPNCAVAK